MTLKETLSILTKIDGFYPGRLKITEDLVRDWHRIIKNQGFDETLGMLDKHVISSKFPPTVHELYIKPRMKVLTSENIFGEHHE
jgi:hypothetical protein